MTDDSAFEDPARRQAALWDVGFAHAMANNPEGAVTLMTAKLAESGLTIGQRVVLASQTARTGRVAEATAMLEAISREDPSLKVECMAEVQAYAFMRRFDRVAAQALLAELHRRFAPGEAGRLEPVIAERLATGRPFLMLRMGDGEGSHIKLNLDDEQRYAFLYRQNRRSFLEFWFDDPALVDAPAWEATMDRFNTVIANADVIGAFSSAAIEHAYGIGSRRDVTWVINTLRKTLEAADRDPAWASRTYIDTLTLHYDLLRTGVLGRLLQGRARVGLVSCHAPLAQALTSHFSVGAVEFHHTPGERSHAHLLGAQALAGRHWPDRYGTLYATLGEGDRRGQLFLVAAGLLGKIYADQLRAAGAVVLDIGAVADLLMGRPTREFPDALRPYALASPEAVEAGSAPSPAPSLRERLPLWLRRLGRPVWRPLWRWWSARR